VNFLKEEFQGKESFLQIRLTQSWNLYLGFDCDQIHYRRIPSFTFCTLFITVIVPHPPQPYSRICEEKTGCWIIQGLY
jgi:hypothetical protein